MNDRSALIITPLLPLLSLAVVSYSPINDSYKESLLIRQLGFGKALYSEDRPKLIASKFEPNTVTDELGGIEYTPQEMLLDFRDNGIPISAIAAMIGVERKTVYSWIDGSPLKLANEERIVTIHKLLNHNRSASYKSLYRYMNKQVEGVTLAEVLNSTPLDNRLAREILSKLWPIAERMEKSLAASETRAGSRNPAIEELTEAYIS